MRPSVPASPLECYLAFPVDLPLMLRRIGAAKPEVSVAAAQGMVGPLVTLTQPIKASATRSICQR